MLRCARAGIGLAGVTVFVGATIEVGAEIVRLPGMSWAILWLGLPRVGLMVLAAAGFALRVALGPLLVFGIGAALANAWATRLIARLLAERASRARP